MKSKAKKRKKGAVSVRPHKKRATRKKRPYAVEEEQEETKREN